MEYISNNMIIKRQTKPNYPELFTDSDITITDMNEVVDRFNSFFVNVGPKLAKEINNSGNRCAEEKCVERNPNSIILRTVVRYCKQVYM